MSLSRTTLTAVSTMALTSVLATGCGDDATHDGPGPAVRERSTSTTALGTSRSPASNKGSDHMENNQMRIQITIGDQRFRATLTDSAAARDLLAQLPVTVNMVDHAGVEKTGPLPAPLSLEGQPEGADPDIGDVGYYAPGNDLVLYYRDQAYFPGIAVLGRLDGDATEHIADLSGPVTATVEAR